MTVIYPTSIVFPILPKAVDPKAGPQAAGPQVTVMTRQVSFAFIGRSSGVKIVRHHKHLGTEIELFDSDSFRFVILTVVHYYSLRVNFTLHLHRPP